MKKGRMRGCIRPFDWHSVFVRRQGGKEGIGHLLHGRGEVLRRGEGSQQPHTLLCVSGWLLS